MVKLHVNLLLLLLRLHFQVSDMTFVCNHNLFYTFAFNNIHSHRLSGRHYETKNNDSIFGA